MASPYAGYIWKFLKGKLQNEYGVAALMGNLEAESALYPNNLQNSYNSSLGYTDSAYTAAVNNGTYTKAQFTSDRGGYGLAQWTTSHRKTGLYEKWKNDGYDSIANIDLQLNFLYWELENEFNGVLSTLKNATSIRSASDVVLSDFENPADQSDSVKQKRASMGQAWFDLYTGTDGEGNPDDTGTPDTPTPSTKRKFPWILMAAIATDID